MIPLTLGGSVRSAATHFALFGLAAICEAQLGVAPRLWWTDEGVPRAQLEAGCPHDAVAEAVRRHAADRTLPVSWVSLRIAHEGRPTATFSPRIKEPTTRAAWGDLQSARTAGIDELHTSRAELDLRMIGALGEQAYWLDDKKRDGGASRWEMKTRNRGEEFIRNRLALLAGHVAARRVEAVLSGLIGASVMDEAAGAKAADSRSATGFARPGPADNAVAWCGLWGISQFPVAHQVNAQSGTAGTFVPPGRQIPAVVFVPVPTQPITLARFRTIVVSRHLATVGAPRPDAEQFDDVQLLSSQKWLRDRSIRALMQFAVHVTDNPSAPERYVLSGKHIPLGDS